MDELAEIGRRVEELAGLVVKQASDPRVMEVAARLAEIEAEWPGLRERLAALPPAPEAPERSDRDLLRELSDGLRAQAVALDEATKRLERSDLTALRALGEQEARLADATKHVNQTQRDLREQATRLDTLGAQIERSERDANAGEAALAAEVFRLSERVAAHDHEPHPALLDALAEQKRDARDLRERQAAWAAASRSAQDGIRNRLTALEAETKRATSLAMVATDTALHERAAAEDALDQRTDTLTSLHNELVTRVAAVEARPLVGEHGHEPPAELGDLAARLAELERTVAAAHFHDWPDRPRSVETAGGKRYAIFVCRTCRGSERRLRRGKG